MKPVFPALDLPLVGDHKNFPQTDAETLVNFYPEKVGSRWIIRSFPGYTLFGNVPGTLGIRAVYSVGPRLFAVRGATFSEWVETEFVVRGTLNSQSGKIGISDNNLQIILVDDGTAYSFTLSDNSFDLIPEFESLGLGGSQVVFSSLRVFAFRPDSSDFWNSSLPTDPPLAADKGVRSWPALNRYSKTSFSGPITALASMGQTLIVFGEGGHEVFAYQGFPDTPMSRVQSGSNIGISAKGSIAVFGQEVYWLGGGEGRGVVFKSSGGEPTRISNSQIEQIISSLPGIQDAVAYTYQENGQVFYLISFMQGRKTLVYNTTSGFWIERVSRNEQGVLGQYIGAYQTRWLGKNMIGDYRNGNIYELSKRFTSDNGDLVFMERAFPQFPSEANRLMRHAGFELMMDMGDADIDARNTEMMLDFSDDKGKTWSRIFPQSIGGQGEYGKRLVEYSLGSAITRNYRIRFTTNREIILREAQVRI